MQRVAALRTVSIIASAAGPLTSVLERSDNAVLAGACSAWGTVSALEPGLATDLRGTLLELTVLQAGAHW